MFYGLLSGLGLLLRLFCFLCYTSAMSNKLYYIGDEPEVRPTTWARHWFRYGKWGRRWSWIVSKTCTTRSGRAWRVFVRLAWIYDLWGRSANTGVNSKLLNLLTSLTHFNYFGNIDSVLSYIMFCYLKIIPDILVTELMWIYAIYTLILV